MDVTQNASLNFLYCFYNQLTSLDITQNTALTSLSCSTNQLTSFDVTKNAALTQLYCYNNQITSLDVNNGNNEILAALDITGNSNLTCVQIDEKMLNNIPVTWLKDGITNYNSDCSKSLSVNNENLESSIRLYPNPVKNSLNIHISNIKETLNLEIHDIQGRIIRYKKLNATKNTIDIGDLKSGVYFIKISALKSSYTKKIIKI